jgi:hypothetical protein
LLSHSVALMAQLVLPAIHELGSLLAVSLVFGGFVLFWYINRNRGAPFSSLFARQRTAEQQASTKTVTLISVPIKRAFTTTGGLFVLLVMVLLCGNMALLYLRTGSFFEMDYEWYSAKNTGARLYAGKVPLPTDILDACPEEEPSPIETFLKVENVSRRFRQEVEKLERTNAYTIVNVVVWYSYKPVRLRPDQLIPIDSIEPPRNVEDSWWEAQEDETNVELCLDHANNAEWKKNFCAWKSSSQHDKSWYVKHVNGVTVFPLFWHIFLGVGSSEVVTVTPWKKVVPSLRIMFRIVQRKETLERLDNSSNVIVITEGMDRVEHFIRAYPRFNKVGFLTLSGEGCNNGGDSAWIKEKTKFGFLTYGDCTLVDHKRYFTMPLGPSVDNDFPLNIPRTHIKSSVKRNYLLNLMVSITVEKPTRLQAWLAASQVCQGKRCYIQQSNLLLKILQKVDDYLGTSLSQYLTSSSGSYAKILADSKFTLCPSGKNPEQYRIWEALSAGSIPIIEKVDDLIPGTFWHPSLPELWRCRPSDIHRILKELKAPVLFVNDWKSDLKSTIENVKLETLQVEMLDWYTNMLHHMTAQMLEQVLQHFS